MLCKQLYESQDTSQRAEAEKALVNFQNAPDTLSKCQLLLDRGDSCYAQLLAATTLTKLVSRSAQGLSLQQRVDIRKCITNLLSLGTYGNCSRYIFQVDKFCEHLFFMLGTLNIVINIFRETFLVTIRY